MGTAAVRAWLHRRRRPQRYAFLDELLKTQALSRSQLLRKQRDDLTAMIRFAREHTAYYAATLRGIPDDAPISALPLLRKEDVVAHLPELLARGHDPATTPLGYTGGSTGRPLAFFYDETKHELMRAGMMRSYMLSGWRPGQKILNFWGARQDTVKGGVFAGAARDDFIAAEKTVTAHAVSPQKLDTWARFIQRYRPVLLQGYASILAALARHVLERGIALPDSLIGVYSTAEMLTEAMRATMESAFGCKVFNQYGSREIPNIACECCHGGMHVFTDMVWLEAVDGKLLVTSLTNRLMPMIRYENGDAGELLDAECTCGLPFPLMAMGLCRQNDFILTPDGRRLHPSFFNRLLYGMTQIEEYQFIQETPRSLTLRFVGPPLAEATAAALRQALAAEGLTLEITNVPHIERTTAGKHRFVICLLDPQHLSPQMSSS